MLGARKWIDIHTPRGNLASFVVDLGSNWNVVQICLELFKLKWVRMFDDAWWIYFWPMWGQGLPLGKLGSPSSDTMQDPAGKLTSSARKVASATCVSCATATAGRKFKVCLLLISVLIRSFFGNPAVYGSVRFLACSSFGGFEWDWCVDMSSLATSQRVA